MITELPVNLLSARFGSGVRSVNPGDVSSSSKKLGHLGPLARMRRFAALARFANRTRALGYDDAFLRALTAVKSSTKRRNFFSAVRKPRNFATAPGLHDNHDRTLPSSDLCKIWARLDTCSRIGSACMFRTEARYDPNALIQRARHFVSRHAKFTAGAARSRCYCSDQILLQATRDMSAWTRGQYLVSRAVWRGPGLHHPIRRAAPDCGPAVPRRLLRVCAGQPVRLHGRSGWIPHEGGGISTQASRGTG